MSGPERAPTPAQPAGERAVTRAFEDAGAVSPATARPLADIAGVEAAAVVPFIARRLVREGAPGRYYLHGATEHARRRAFVLVLFVVVLLVGLLLVLPVFLLRVRGGR